MKILKIETECNEELFFSVKGNPTDEELKNFVYTYCEYDEELEEMSLYIPSDWYYVTYRPSGL